MSTLLQWLTEPEWSQVVKTLLHSLWQGALIAVALALAMRRVVNPHWRYRFSLVALAGIPIAGIITWATLNTSNRPLTIATPAPVTTEAAAPAITLNQNPNTKVVLLTNHSPAPPPVRWTAWLALLWLVGTGAMLGRAGIKLAGAEQLRRSCQPLENAQVTQLLAKARRAVGLARKIRVAVTDKLTSPAVVGVMVPTLILPLSLVTTLTPDQIHFILLHELAHIRRGDYFANLFQLFVEALLFFNPAVWWISHQLRREREACCDALAIELSGAPVDYARTLVHVAENVLNPVPDAATAFGGKREPTSLADRVQRLLVPGYRPSLRLTWRAMIAAFVLGAVMLVLSAEGTRVAVAQITKPSAQTASEKETQSQVDKPKSEVTEQFSKSLSDFKSTDWLLGTNTLSGENQLNRQWFWYRTTNGSHVVQVDPDSARGMADWKVDASNKLNLPRLDIAGVNEHSRIEHNAATGRTVITNGGIVRFQGKDTEIRADSILVDQKSGELVATGNIRMTSPSGSVDIPLLELRLSTSSIGAATTNVPYLGDLPFVGKLFVSESQTNNPTRLFVREFNLDPIVFTNRLAQKGCVFENPVNVTNISSCVRRLFSEAGIDLDPAKGKSVFYNDRRGILLVRATMEELDRVEQLVVELNRPEPQVKVKVRFVEVSPSELEAFVLDLIATMKPAVAQNWTGNLTESQMDQVLHRIQTNKNISVLSEGEVTTASGRQAQLQTVEIKTIVTGINPKALAPPGITVTNSAASGESSLITSQIPFGSTIDLIPTITADGYSISLTVTPQVTEFLGYERSTNTVVYENGKKGKVTFPLPQLRTRQMKIHTAVRDGVTLVMGAAPVETSTRLKEKVPVLGDIPGIGGLFRNESSQVRTNVLLVFVTPTIVDPAAKRPATSATNKNGDDESFITSTNLRPVIDYHEPRIDYRRR